MIRSIINYFQFFTRIPINYRIEDPVKSFKKGVPFMGVFGLVYGVLLVVPYYLLRLRVGILEAWLIVLLLDVIYTGAFHHDALADAADGLFSGRDKERKLEIMKDSRIGSNGVVALIMYYLIVVFYGGLVLTATGDVMSEVVMILTLYIISRSALTMTFRQSTYQSQTQNGLGSVLTGIPTYRILITQLLAVSWSYLFWDLKGVMTYLMTILLIELYRKGVYKLVQGINGDTAGASILISQMIWLIVWQIL